MKTPSFEGYDAPALLDVVEGRASRELRLKVPERPGYLDGHFPDLPIVPAVIQIRWVMEAVRPLLGADAVLERAEALKFKELLRPGDVFHLRVEVSAKTVAFRLWHEARLFASGRLVATTRETHE